MSAFGPSRHVALRSLMVAFGAKRTLASSPPRTIYEFTLQLRSPPRRIGADLRLPRRLHDSRVEPDARWQWRDLIFAKGHKVKRLGRVVRRAAHPVRVSPHALDNRPARPFA